MKTAEREISRAIYAFDLVEANGGLDQLLQDDINQKVRDLPGKEERVLITGDYNGRYEGWHPTLGEFKLVDPN
jgi:hypothetical protein